MRVFRFLELALDSGTSTNSARVGKGLNATVFRGPKSFNDLKINLLININ